MSKDNDDDQFQDALENPEKLEAEEKKSPKAPQRQSSSNSLADIVDDLFGPQEEDFSELEKRSTLGKVGLAQPVLQKKDTLPEPGSPKNPQDQKIEAYKKERFDQTSKRAEQIANIKQRFANLGQTIKDKLKPKTPSAPKVTSPRLESLEARAAAARAAQQESRETKRALKLDLQAEKRSLEAQAYAEKRTEREDNIAKKRQELSEQLPAQKGALENKRDALKAIKEVLDIAKNSVKAEATILSDLTKKSQNLAKGQQEQTKQVEAAEINLTKAQESLIEAKNRQKNAEETKKLLSQTKEKAKESRVELDAIAKGKEKNLEETQKLLKQAQEELETIIRQDYGGRATKKIEIDEIKQDIQEFRREYEDAKKTLAAQDKKIDEFTKNIEAAGKRFGEATIDITNGEKRLQNTMNLEKTSKEALKLTSQSIEINDRELFMSQESLKTLKDKEAKITSQVNTLSSQVRNQEFDIKKTQLEQRIASTEAGQRILEGSQYIGSKASEGVQYLGDKGSQAKQSISDAWNKLPKTEMPTLEGIRTAFQQNRNTTTPENSTPKPTMRERAAQAWKKVTNKGGRDGR